MNPPSFFLRPLPETVMMFCCFGIKALVMARGIKGKVASCHALFEQRATITRKGTGNTEINTAASPYLPTHCAGHTPTTMPPPSKSQSWMPARLHYVPLKNWGFPTIPSLLEPAS